MNHRCKIFIYTVCFFGLLFVSQGKSQTPFSHEVDSLIQQGIDQTFQSEFDSALSTFNEVINRIPDHLAGYFYVAATYQSMMMDYETDAWEETFMSKIDSAIEMGRALVDVDNPDPWTQYYLGSCYNYKGLYQAKSGSLVPGFVSARKGLRYLRKAVESEPSLNDCFLGLGSFDYWSGRFYKYLDWMPWFEDERERGVNRVRQAIEQSIYSRWVSINGLAWIEYDRQNYKEALRLFLMGLDKYSGSRYFLWGAADTQFRLKNYDDAARRYEALLMSIQKSPMTNGYNEIVCRFKLVRTYMGSRRLDEAVVHCGAILQKQVDENVEKRVKKRRDQTKKYKKEILKLMNSQ